MQTKSLVFALTSTVWAVASATAVFWLLQQVGTPSQASNGQKNQAKVVPLAISPTKPVSAAELATLLGQTEPGVEAVPDSANRFRLLGVVMQEGGGAALLAMDDQPAKPYRVGGRLDETTFLQAVGPRHVMLGTGSSSASGLRLELQPSDVRTDE